MSKGIGVYVAQEPLQFLGFRVEAGRPFMAAHAEMTEIVKAGKAIRHWVRYRDLEPRRLA